MSDIPDINLDLEDDIKLGKPFFVHFFDHAQSSGDEIGPIECKVLGWLIKEDDLCYYVCSWSCGDKVDDNNSECFSILKSTVIDKHFL